MDSTNWQTRRFLIDLSRPRVMGIVNVTPDSFSDGGQHATTRAALGHCEQLLKDGADILDIGGESTRPGATPVSAATELDRVLPVLREAVRWQVPISIDTYKPEVMQAALDAGADIINDVWALRWRAAAGAQSGSQVIARYPNCGVCLMHMHGEPMTMQQSPLEGDVVHQVLWFWRQAVHSLCAHGVHKSQIVLDPGIGFGKTTQQNFTLLARQRELLSLELPLLLGWSRKSSLAVLTGLGDVQPSAHSAHPRMVPSVAAALLAVERGAAVVRVHDVRETVLALRVWGAIK